MHEHEKTQETAKGPMKVFESSSHLDEKTQLYLREKFVRDEYKKKGKIKSPIPLLRIPVLLSEDPKPEGTRKKFAQFLPCYSVFYSV